MKMNQYGHAWSKSVHETKKLNLPTEQRFIFFHNPRNWELAEFKDGRRTIQLLLPSLNSLILEAGVNGVRSNGSGVDYSLAIANLQSSGCVVLLPEQHDYMVCYPVHGGKHYTTKFTIIEDIAGTIIKSFDTEGFNDFRRMLVVNGHIQPPHKHFIRLMLSKIESTITRCSGDLHNPASKARYEKALLYEKQVKQAKEQIIKHGKKAYEFRKQNEKNNQSISKEIS